MNNSLKNVIKEIVKNYGETILSEPKRVSAFLADLAREEPKPKKNALVKCLEYGFAQILKNVSESERVICKQKLAQRLHEEEGLDLGLCRETVELIAAVLFGASLIDPSAADLFAKWRLIRTFDGFKNYERITSIAFSPDSEYIVTGSNLSLKLWEIESGWFVHTFEGYEGNIDSAAYSPDGKYITTVSRGNTLKLWEAASGRLVSISEVHDEKVKSVAFSPNGNYFVSRSQDKKLELRDAKSEKLIRSFEEHEVSIESFTFSPDSKYIASGSYEKNVKLWETESGQLIRTFDFEENDTRTKSIAAFSPNGKYIFSASGNSLYQWGL